MAGRRAHKGAQRSRVILRILNDAISASCARAYEFWGEYGREVDGNASKFRHKNLGYQGVEGAIPGRFLHQLRREERWLASNPTCRGFSYVERC